MIRCTNSTVRKVALKLSEKPEELENVDNESEEIFSMNSKSSAPLSSNYQDTKDYAQKTSIQRTPVNKTEENLTTYGSPVKNCNISTKFVYKVQKDTLGDLMGSSPVSVTNFGQSPDKSKLLLQQFDKKVYENLFNPAVLNLKIS